MFDAALLDIPIVPAWPRVTLRRVLLLLAWLLCIAVAWQRFDHSVHEFDTGDRPPSTLWGKSNRGHAQIDFGGQWLMGRMVVTGQGKQLYNRNRHWHTLRGGYPASGDTELVRRHAFPAANRPADVLAAEHKGEEFKSDAENLMTWTMGSDHDSKRWGEAAEGIACAFVGGIDGNPFGAAASQQMSRKILSPELIDELDRPSVGGPLYPPVHALLYAPLGLIADAQMAYTVLQIVGILGGFVAGWAAQWLSRGRLAWPVCSTLIFFYPGFRPGLDLGQNHAISLAILLLGWALAVRGYQCAGGAVWGLFAFKPVWGIVFALVPLLMLRWRIVLAMGVVGCGLAIASLPVVGLNSWLDWLENGKEATETYNTNKNWIELSRDLAGLPKRILLDFSKPAGERPDPVADLSGWILWGCVFAGTIAIYWFRANRREPTGLGAGFLFLGAYHCCFRFMYYDVLLSAAGVLVMCAHPGLFFRTPQFKLLGHEPGPFQRRARLYGVSIPLLLIALLLWNENGLMNFKPKASIGADYFAVPTTSPEGKATFRTPVLSAASDYQHPVDTVLLLLLWAWAGWRLLRDGDYPLSASRAAPMSGERISDSPTSTA